MPDVEKVSLITFSAGHSFRHFAITYTKCLFVTNTIKKLILAKIIMFNRIHIDLNMMPVGHLEFHHKYFLPPECFYDAAVYNHVKSGANILFSGVT